MNIVNSYNSYPGKSNYNNRPARGYMTEENAKSAFLFVYLNDFTGAKQKFIPFFNKEGYTEIC